MVDHKDQLRAFKINGYVHYLDCGNGFMNLYICQNLHQLYLQKMVKTQIEQTLKWARGWQQIYNMRDEDVLG